MSQPLNVLIIMSDQHHADYLGAAGHPFIRTPNLDRLAAQGVRFNNAYCPSPLCGPSRMSFLTGLYPHETGVYSNGQVLNSDLPTFAHAFEAAGFDTALIGRMHIVGPDQHHGFQDRMGGDVTASTMGGGRYPALDGLPAGSSQAGFLYSGAGDSMYHHYDDQVTDLAVDWLSDARRHDKPFMATVGLALPHLPFVCSREDYDFYEPLVKLPDTWRGDATITHGYLAELFRRQGGQKPLDEEAYRRSLIAYCGCVTATDRRVGRILQALESDAALAARTLVIYCSDHGEAAAEHGLWYKSSMLEGSARVPLILRVPGTRQAGAVDDHVVNLIDIGPTVLQHAGGPQLPLVSGRSFAHLSEHPDRWINETFCEYGGSHAPGLCRMVRHEQWKCVYYVDHPPQLFNLAQDPGETRDLAADPGHQVILQQLQARLLCGWDPTAITARNEAWKQRNALLYAWYMARPRHDDELFTGPQGCNRIDPPTTFAPAADERRDSY